MADPEAAPQLRFLFLETLRPATAALWRCLYSVDSEVRRDAYGAPSAHSATIMMCN